MCVCTRGCACEYEYVVRVALQSAALHHEALQHHITCRELATALANTLEQQRAYSNIGCALREWSQVQPGAIEERIEPGWKKQGTEGDADSMCGNEACRCASRRNERGRWDVIWRDVWDDMA